MIIKAIPGGKESGAFANQENKKNYFQQTGIPLFKVIVNLIFHEQ